MPATESTHSPTPEEVMAYLDGETPADACAAIETHLASCAVCQDVVSEFRGLSARAADWTVGAPPAALTSPGTPRVPRPFARIPRLFSWRPSYLVITFGGAAVTLMLVADLVSYTKRVPALPSVVSEPRARVSEQPAPPPGSVGGLAQRAMPPSAVTGTLEAPAAADALTVPESKALVRSLIRTATLRLVARDFDAARPAVETLAAQTGGFIDQMTAAGSPGSARTLTGTLRVPSDRLAEALGRLRQLGQVTEDTQGAEDVTDQVVDLDARLANARATEQRLTDILKNRTGKLSDVLDVERELARVRLEIEQMDARRGNIGRRVTYASIAIDISEERKAGLGGPLPLTTRLRIAAADGVHAALDSLVGAVLFVLRAGPIAMLWGAAALCVWMIARRVRRERPSG